MFLDKLSELITGEPIWSMWDQFKVARLTEERLLQTGNELQRHGYSGIIDIDDVWEVDWIYNLQNSF